MNTILKFEDSTDWEIRKVINSFEDNFGNICETKCTVTSEDLKKAAVTTGAVLGVAVGVALAAYYCPALLAKVGAGAKAAAGAGAFAGITATTIGKPLIEELNKYFESSNLQLEVCE